ncbi:hypothetical protein PTKIN_Ptkin12aG0111700 [Pterospermum kingtungense]
MVYYPTKHPAYDEPRRNGKVLKILTHRLFPQAHYNIWIDDKMELIVDSLLILERGEVYLKCYYDVFWLTKVDYSGTVVSLKSIAQISTLDLSSMLVQPYDKSSLKVIEKAIVHTKTKTAKKTMR